jgi:hypothetical protein
MALVTTVATVLRIVLEDRQDRPRAVYGRRVVQGSRFLSELWRTTDERGRVDPARLRSAPLAFDGKLLGQVLRIFTDTIAANYRKRQAQRGVVDRQGGAVTVIPRANSDLRLSPHFHVLQLDGLDAPGLDGAPIFHPAPSPNPSPGLSILIKSAP